MARGFDWIVVGTGFASSFFLESLLARSGANTRVLVLEKGERRSHAWQLGKGGSFLTRSSERSWHNQTPVKPWAVSLAFGGGSNCWWANTPRLLPNDFRTHSAYGVGRDWPLGYDELEPFYTRAEQRMAVAGPRRSPFPRSAPYPQPAHRLSEPDRLLAAAYPQHFFALPAARPTRALASGRPACCASGVCGLCPIDSKFSIQNEMAALYEDERVTLETGASVQAVDLEAGVARGVRYVRDGRERLVRGDAVVLGANALFNPHILLRSGLQHAQLGRNLYEQVSLTAIADLAGVDNFQGGTSLTGHGYMLYDGAHRRERSAVLLETWNVPELRPERGKWRQRLKLRCIFEDFPLPQNRVELVSDDPARPSVRFERRSDPVRAARARIESDLARVLAPLPLDALHVKPRYEATESHVLGTVVMGDDPTTSVVDRHLTHHGVRNLFVLGGSAFPTSSPANPTLTIAALSLWAAQHALASASGGAA